MDRDSKNKCEKCGKDHNGLYGSGRFCSEKCARSFSTYEKREEINRKVSQKLKGIDYSILKITKVDERIRLNLKETSYKIKKEKEKRKEKVEEGIECLRCRKLTTNAKFCSPKCSDLYRNEENVRMWKNGEIDGSKCDGKMVSIYVRKYLFEKYNCKCCKCGWSEISKYTGKIPLEVDHIDGNYTNNREDNLRLLCPNCHSLTSTYKALNKGNGRPYIKYR